MGQIVTDLRSLLLPRKATQQGTVAGLGADFVTVATSGALKTFPTALGASYRVGDSVLMQGEVLVGRVASELNIPSYSV